MYFSTNLSKISCWQIISTVVWPKEGRLLKKKIKYLCHGHEFFWYSAKNNYLNHKNGIKKPSTSPSIYVLNLRKSMIIPCIQIFHTM